MKKLSTLFVALALALTASPQTWYVGSPNATDVTATLDNSVMTISGIGAMANFAWDGSPWYSVGSSITSVVIEDGVTSIGDWAFRGCTGLTSVTIPNSVTTIGGEAFRSCRGLTSVTIPNSVTNIDVQAFYACSSLTEVTIPNSVTTIGDLAFAYCRGLTSVTIGNSVTSIGEQAFQGCTGLTSVTIPNSVTTIGWGAFYECTGLTSVTVGWSTPLSINSNVFEDVPVQNVQLFVPYGTEDAYRAADVWQDFRVLGQANSGGGGDVGTSAQAQQATALRLYPNPTTTGQLVVEYGEWQAGELVQIYSLSGALVATYPATSEVTTINLSHLPSGTYVLRVGRYTAKFVKR